MDLDLPFGPWKEIASADWNGIPTGIYANPEKLLLVVAFPKEPANGNGNGNAKPSPVPAGKQGVLVLLKKPLFLEGSAAGVEKFVQGQMRDLSLVSKVVDKKHFTFVLLEAQPFFVEFRKEELVKAVKEQYDEIKSLAQLAFDVARSYGCRARELGETEESVGENLLGDPMMLFALGGFKTKKLFSALDEKKAVLGFSPDGTQVDVSPSEMQTTLVLGGARQGRLGALQVCVENLLVSGIPCIAVGESDFLQGLAFPNKTAFELEKAGLPRASGFPLKSYALGKGFYIDLRRVSAKSFSQLFLPADLKGVVEKAWGEASLSGLIEKLEPNSQKYPAAKALRILKTVERAYPGVFAPNSVEELKNPWGEKTGRAVLLGADGLLQALAIECILNSLGEPKEGQALGIVLEADVSKLPAALIASVSSLQNKVFFVLSASSSSDSIASITPTLQIDVLGEGSEAVVAFSGEKKRLALRPPFSSGGSS